MLKPLYSLLICLIFELLCTASAAAHDSRLTGNSPSSEWSTAAVESFVDAVIHQQLEKRKIAGAAVTIVKDGRVVLCKGCTRSASILHPVP